MGTRQFLVVDVAGGYVGLNSLAEVRAILRVGRVPVVVDLDAALAGFKAKVGTDYSRTFTLAEVAAIAGVSRSTAFYWADEGLLYPSVLPCRGSGHVRLWSYQDAFMAGVTGALSRQAVPVKVLRQITNALVEARQRKVERSGKVKSEQAAVAV